MTLEEFLNLAEMVEQYVASLKNPN